MKILGIIPSRYQSTRLPGKPLKDIGGTSMIMRVFHQASKVTAIDKVVVATDDSRIFDHVKASGGEVVMTSDQHDSGTSRCIEVCEQFPGYDWVVNIQGDEPSIDPRQVETLISCFDEETDIATLCRQIDDENELFSPDVPKVVVDANGYALYFSRSTIPNLREVPKEQWLAEQKHFKHIGIYAYKAEVLATLGNFTPSILEKEECLEQLRWLYNGLKIKVLLTEFDSISVDTKEDLEKVRRLLGHY